MHACQACLSYSLIMRVCFRITLAVVFLSVKVIIIHITLQVGGHLLVLSPEMLKSQIPISGVGGWGLAANF